MNRMVFIPSGVFVPDNYRRIAIRKQPYEGPDSPTFYVIEAITLGGESEYYVGDDALAIAKWKAWLISPLIGTEIDWSNREFPEGYDDK